MRCLSPRRTSFPAYDSKYLADVVYELAKYRGIQVTKDSRSIDVLYAYNKLIYDSRNNQLDPYPSINIANWQPLMDAMSKLAKAIVNNG